MKKESAIAAISGILFGIIIAVIILISLKKQEIKTSKIISPQITPTIAVMNIKSQTLELLSPQPDQVVNKNIITLKGKAEKGSLIVLQSSTTEKVFKNVEGNFSFDMPLSMGENLIKITSYKDKFVEEKSVKVYFIEE